MSEEMKNIMDKFDRILKNYEIDKAFGQLSIDSVCHLFPGEIETIMNYIKELEEYKSMYEGLCD